MVPSENAYTQFRENLLVISGIESRSTHRACWPSQTWASWIKGTVNTAWMLFYGGLNKKCGTGPLVCIWKCKNQNCDRNEARTVITACLPEFGVLLIVGSCRKWSDRTGSQSGLVACFVTHVRLSVCTLGDSVIRRLIIVSTRARLWTLSQASWNLSTSYQPV